MKLLRMLGSAWAVIGFTLLLGMAIYRLAPHAQEMLAGELTVLHWVLLAVSVIFMGYSEGYKAFQKAYCPRLAARVRYLWNKGTVLQCVLAPLFAMAFFHATKKRIIVAYCLTSGIILLVVLVRMLAQPWRGIVDAGVVVGLTWGLLAFFYCLVRIVVQPSFRPDPELSEKFTA